MKRDTVGIVIDTVPDMDDPTGESYLDARMEEDDPELQASGSDTELMLSENPILKDVDIPSEKNPKMFTKVDRLRWEDAVETLMARGASIAAIAKLTNISMATSRSLVMRVREKWASTLSPSTVNIRREQLYTEADRVKNYCFAALNSGTLNPAMSIRFLQLILAAGQRQSNLIGAEKINIGLEATVQAQHKGEQDFIDESALSGLSPEQLRAIGDTIAKQMKGRADE